jgi:hypothetical protein
MKGRSKIHRVGFIGGLGNQLFQYSFGLWLGQAGGRVTYDASALRSGSRRLELSGLIPAEWLPQEKWLMIMPYPRGRLGRIGEFVRVISGPRRVRFEDQVDIPGMPEDVQDAWWYGYWQSPERVRATLPDLRGSMAGVLPSINPGTVGIHVRRGDYVGNDMLLSPQYYREALKSLIAAHNLDMSLTVVFVFSDDPEWCAQELNFDVPVQFSSQQDTRSDFLSLMACEYLVLSRSTFSWWAAVLPDRPERQVMSPYPFVPAPAGLLDYPGWLHHAVE